MERVTGRGRRHRAAECHAAGRRARCGSLPHEKKSEAQANAAANERRRRSRQRCRSRRWLATRRAAARSRLTRRPLPCCTDWHPNDCTAAAGQPRPRVRLRCSRWKRPRRCLRWERCHCHRRQLDGESPTDRSGEAARQELRRMRRWRWLWCRNLALMAWRKVKRSVPGRLPSTPAGASEAQRVAQAVAVMWLGSRVVAVVEVRVVVRVVARVVAWVATWAAALRRQEQRGRREARGHPRRSGWAAAGMARSTHRRGREMMSSHFALAAGRHSPGHGAQWMARCHLGRLAPWPCAARIAMPRALTGACCHRLRATPTSAGGILVVHAECRSTARWAAEPSAAVRWVAVYVVAPWSIAVVGGAGLAVPQSGGG